MAKVTFIGVGIQNFGPFRERQYLNLVTTVSRPILLVRALNGSGKTTLLTSLQVVLYGAKLYSGGRTSEYEQLIRSLQRSDAIGPPRIDIDLRVEAHGDVEEITVSREWTITKGKFIEQLAVHRGEAFDAQLTDDWEEFIDGILPAELAQLFLFDGEKIEALANPQTLPDMLRRATEAFLGIGGIDTLAKDLTAVERRTFLKSKNDTQEYTDATAELRKLEQQHSDLDQKVDQLKQAQGCACLAFETAQKEVNRFRAKAEREGLASYEKAGELRAAEQLSRQRVAEAESRVRDALADPWSAIGKLGYLWSEYKQLWDEEQETRAAKHLLGEITKRDKRILEAAERVIPVSSVAALKGVLSEDAKQYLTVSNRKLHLIESAPPEQESHKVRSAQSRYGEAIAALEVARLELGSCELKLSAVPKGEQVAEILEKMQVHSNALAQADAEHNRIKALHEEAFNSRAYINTRVNATLDRLKKDFRGYAHELKMMEASERSRSVLSIYKDKLLASKAEWLASMITEEFASLMRKRKLVDRVCVDPKTYDVTIIAPDGHELPMSRLSAGERQLLAIAVLSALIRERKGQFPVVVDTPLARLDKKHRRALIQRFFSKISHQVMVLSTDEEVDGEIYTEMSNFTSKSYELHFSDDTRSTTVGPLEVAII